MTLIDRQGYAGTTVEQIAREAQVSHTTFFRYFASKEQVIIKDDLGGERTRALESIPAGLNHFDLLRELVKRIYRLIETDPWASDRRRMELIFREPELRQAYQIDCERGLSDATGFFAEYLGVPRDDIRLRVFIAAACGVILDIAHDVDDDINGAEMNRILGAVDLLEQGLPVWSCC